MGGETTIFQVDKYAIDRHSYFNLQRKYWRHNITILTGSQAAIKGPARCTLSWYANKLNMLDPHYKVWILWVPGYIALEGNETANKLAPLLLLPLQERQNTNPWLITLNTILNLIYKLFFTTIYILPLKCYVWYARWWYQHFISIGTIGN